MTETTVASYVMDPATDVVLYGDEVAEGMWVLPDALLRAGGTEDERLRANRFRRVTKLRPYPASGNAPPGIAFVGEWVDGYQEAHRYAVIWAWIVRKDSLPGAAATVPDGGETE